MKKVKLDSQHELLRLINNIFPDDLIGFNHTEGIFEQLFLPIKLSSPEFISNTAIHFREKTSPVNISSFVLTALLCRYHGKEISRNCVSKVVKNSVDMLTLMEMFFHINAENHVNIFKGTESIRKLSRKMPKSLQQGLRNIFESGKFNAQCYKKQKEKLIKFRDILFLTHPKPQNPTMELLFRNIINNNI